MSTAITGLPMSQMCSMPYPITLQGDCLMPAWRWIYKYSDLSAMAESQFSTFFVRRPRPKLRIYLFLIFRRGGNEIFAVFYSSAAAESLFSAFSRFQPWMTNYFHENWWFTPVFEQLFLKIDNLLSYLSSLFWKLTIYYRIWIVFLENLQFTIVSEQIFLKIDDLLPYLGYFP